MFTFDVLFLQCFQKSKTLFIDISICSGYKTVTMDFKHKDHILNLANSIIGVSILAMPYCFRQCGILLSIVLLIFSSILCRLACHFLLKSAINARLKTFEFLAYHAFGSFGKLFIEIGMIGYLMGTCVAFFVVIGDLGPQIVSELTNTENKASLRTTILVAIALFCVLPLGLLRNISSLSGVSLATIGFYLSLVLKIVAESVPHIVDGDWYNKVELWRPEGLLQCLPIFSMALFCQTQVFEIYQEIPNASLDKMNELVRIAVNICSFVYIFVGTFGYVATSKKEVLSGNILMDFMPTSITQVMKIGFVLSVAVSFPLVIFPCRVSLYSLLFKPVYTSLHDSKFYIPETKFQLLTVTIVAASLAIGIVIPSIELVLGLVGSTIGVMVCLIFPAGCFICLTQRNTNERILAQLMLVIGLSIMVLGTYANIYAIDTMPERIPDQFTSKQIEVKVKVALDEKVQKDRHLDNSVKEIQIKEPDAEIRHEPPQPEEPIDTNIPGESIKTQAISNLERNEEKHDTNLEQPINDSKKPDVPDVHIHVVKETLNKSAPKVAGEKEAKSVPEVKEDVSKQDVIKIKEQEGPKINQQVIVNAKSLQDNKDIEKNVVEVDIEAIKKEDNELANMDADEQKLDEHKRIVEVQQQLLETNKLLLEEIKLRQEKEHIENKQRAQAVKNIEYLAKKAIEGIVDKQKLKQRNSSMEKSPILEGTKPIPPNPAPLSYQLGLQNHSNSEIHQSKSSTIELVKSPLNQTKIDNSKLSKFAAPINTHRESSQEKHEIERTLNVDILKAPKKDLTNLTVKETDPKLSDKSDHHRDLLSKDYERYKRDTRSDENCDNGTKSLKSDGDSKIITRDLKSVPLN